MKTIITIIMTIWDNDLTDFDRNDILRYCENALLDTWDRLTWHKAPEVRLERERNGFKATIPWETTGHGRWDATHFLKIYNDRLMKYAYWNRLDEPLVMEWDLKTE